MYSRPEIHATEAWLRKVDRPSTLYKYLNYSKQWQSKLNAWQEKGHGRKNERSPELGLSCTCSPVLSTVNSPEERLPWTTNRKGFKSFEVQLPPVLVTKLLLGPPTCTPHIAAAGRGTHIYDTDVNSYYLPKPTMVHLNCTNLETTLFSNPKYLNPGRKITIHEVTLWKHGSEEME